MTTEGWPDDRLTSSDVPSLVRHHVGPADDTDRYELLGEAEGADEAWHVLDHRAASGEALYTLAALRPAAVDGLEVVHSGTDEDGQQQERPPSPDEVWRERAAGLARVRHARLAGVVTAFAGPAPHLPGQADWAGAEWHYAVLEQASGRSVADWLRDDPGASVEERFTVLATAASVLQELHRGTEDSPALVHGDITPRSVRLGGFWPSDGVRLSGASLGGLRNGPVQQNSTSVYLAPEVRAGALPSTASDVFGFGATAVFVLTGMPPATSPDGDVDPALVRRQLAAASLTAPYPGVFDLLLQALAADPALRPDRLPAWVNGMRAFVEQQRPPVRGELGPLDGVAVGAAAETVALPTARVTRSLPKRPIIVVVGALLLATAGTAVAIAAVQQGRLKDVPNPVAIVQPPEPTEAAPTSTLPQATSDRGGPDDSSSTSSRSSRSSSSSERSSSSDVATPPPAAVAPTVAPTTAPSTAAPSGTPSASVIPPTTGPGASVPPGTRTPTEEPTSSPPPTTTTPTDSPTTDTPTGTPSDPTGTSSPTDSVTSSASAPDPLTTPPTLPNQLPPLASGLPTP